MNRMRKKEALFFGILLLMAAAAWAVSSKQKDGRRYGSIRITVGGKPYGSYSLADEQIIRINATNTCRIRNGKAKMTGATCPDHLCMHQQAIDSRGGMIICLPNKVIIEGIPSLQEATDALIPDAISG